jgi:GTP-binding protein
VIVRSADFEISAVKPAQWAEDGLPEFAFVGRSNVGKSSLLNRILGRKSLARVSGKPGKTQQINFFRINDQFRLVDLPGYGYASVSKTARAQFAKMIETYLMKRDVLVRIMHLIDIRHEPTKNDIQVHAWLLTLGVPLCVVATKSDKISKSAVKPSCQKIEKILSTPWPVVPVSSEKNVGIPSLWQVVETDLLEYTPPLPTEAGVSDEHAEENQ